MQEYSVKKFLILTLFISTLSTNLVNSAPLNDITVNISIAQGAGIIELNPAQYQSPSQQDYTSIRITNKNFGVWVNDWVIKSPLKQLNYPKEVTAKLSDCMYLTQAGTIKDSV
jgi:hypothetical protein